MGRCRMAYTLNNDQPVKCSIISDQPLFYMDFEDESFLEDECDEFFDFTTIEKGVSDLSDKIESLEKRHDCFAFADEASSYEEFLEDASIICEPHNGVSAQDTSEIEKAIRTSRLGGAFLEFASQYNTKLVFDAQVSEATYDRTGGNIHINPNLAITDQILLSIRELRRVWQHRNGALINPLTFHPDQAILVNRAQIADLSVIMVRVAWEMQLAGEKEVWARVEGSSLADLARSFARESYLDFRTLNNGLAQSAVFESWFLSERCRIEDKRLIQMMLADYHGYVFDNEHTSQNITSELIVALGSMPFGKNYLAPYVGTIISDEIFTEIRDRSNANFLWFIKFERSFRETEQELQAGYDVSDQGNDLGLFNNNHTRFGDHETETEIITLPQGGKGGPSSEDGTDNNIIQFRHRSGKT